MVPKPVGWTRRGLLPGSDLTPLKRLLSGQWAPPRSARDRVAVLLDDLRGNFKATSNPSLEKLAEQGPVVSRKSVETPWVGSDGLLCAVVC